MESSGGFGDPATGTERRRGHRRRADAEMHRLNAELEERVIDRTRALEEANRALQTARQEAERANRAKSEFLSRMSHDLRTPLNSILGFAQLLAGEQDESDRAEYTRQILAGGRHLLQLVNEVLDIARIETGQLSLSPEPVHVPEIAQQILNLVAPLAAAREIELTIEPSTCNDIAVYADRQRLAQILMNLMSNAVKYNRRGGSVTLRCAEQVHNHLRIAVSDTGVGIAPEKLPLLFQPFERLDADAAIEGTGLGLAVSRGLANAMGGSIGVESRVGHGTTFWLDLPISEELPAAIDQTQHASVPVVRADIEGTVLYIEDNLSNVQLMERIVRRRPRVKLLHASGGRAGIALAREHRPSVIFLDLHLPDLIGEEVLHVLREDPDLRAIPVAVVSADAVETQIHRLKSSGATAYLTKPLDIGKVLDLLDMMLSMSVVRTR